MVVAIDPEAQDNNRMVLLAENSAFGSVFMEGGPLIANDVVGTWTLIATAYVRATLP